MQLWFLSVILNVLSGLTLIFSLPGEAAPEGDSSPAPGFFSNKTYRLVLGILTALTGVLKLGVPLQGPGVIGDLLPAAAGIVAGVSLLVVNYADRVELPGILRRVCVDEKKYTGMLCVIVGGLHFVFPRVFFL